MRGGVFPDRISEAEAGALITAEPSMVGLDLAREVTPHELTVVGDGDIRIAAIDTGIKSSIVRNLVQRGATVELHPCTATPEEVVASSPDAVFLANGPGDPAALEYVVDTLRALIGPRPVFGICLGHQLLGRAVGGRTVRLKFGHRGVNQPVVEAATGRVAVTSHNHGFAVDEASLPDGVRVTHRNANDGVVEGLECRDVPAFSVQYHPEAAPGPHDAHPLFERFASLMEGARRD
jgi:carbamoyl-phosphate synthase small subunit